MGVAASKSIFQERGVNICVIIGLFWTRQSDCENSMPYWESNNKEKVRRDVIWIPWHAHPIENECKTVALCRLKTLFNIVEAPFIKLFMNFDVCVVWLCSDGSLNRQEYKSFEIYAVSIKKSMTEYHHWINELADHLF